MSKIQEVANIVIAGRAKLAAGAVQAALDEGCDPNEILGGMIDAMGVVGEKFKNNEIFVPEMLVAAKAMKRGVEVLKPHLAAGEVGAMGKMIIGTVAGDLHDIGKNLVALMMRSANLEVIDLGSNVDGAKFIDAINKYNPDVIGLSALLTTTMNEQGHIIQQLTDAGVRDKVKVMVGGAPVTQMWADKIGADAFTADAAEAAQWAKTYAASKGA